MGKKRKSRVLRILLVTTIFIVVTAIAIYFILGRSFDSISNAISVESLLSRLGEISTQSSKSTQSRAQVKYKFAVISDNHEDTSVYPKIVEQIAARSDLVFVAHLGDQSNAGERIKLQESKGILDNIEVPVYVLPGDHDSNWVPRRDLTNFKQVFNLQQTSYAVTHESERYIFIDNSDGNEGISTEAWDWLSRDLESSQGLNKYVLMSTPLSNPYLTFKTMGAQSNEVKQQAEDLGKMLMDYGVKAIFAGDTHTFSQYKDESTNIPIITVGATGVNKNPLPLYVVVEILSDGSYNVSSIPLKQ